ncbi:MAG: hypothetical protein HY231_02675 [Acidobacteria bacterium]|nr:hypothetical protein [Acidobacteriota bacterium]
MTDFRQVNIEGYTPEEILALPYAEVEALVFCDEPFAFRAGSAEILGEFRFAQDRLVVELAHIDGGGEGVLLALWILAERYAKQRDCHQVEWIVHALTCAKPNLKLRRLLERKGFVIKTSKENVAAYTYLHCF